MVLFCREGTVINETQTMIDGLSATSSFCKTYYWSWYLARLAKCLSKCCSAPCCTLLLHVRQRSRILLFPSDWNGFVLQVCTMEEYSQNFEYRQRLDDGSGPVRSSRCDWKIPLVGMSLHTSTTGTSSCYSVVSHLHGCSSVSSSRKRHSSLTFDRSRRL